MIRAFCRKRFLLFRLPWLSLLNFRRHYMTSITSFTHITGFTSHDYSLLLQDCIQQRNLNRGKSLHCRIIKQCSTCIDLFAHNILLNFYVKFDLFDDARKLFDELPVRNSVSFVTFIQGCLSSGFYCECIELFSQLHREGVELQPFVLTTVLKLLVSMERPQLCTSVHACAHKLGHDSNAFIATALIDAYSECGLVGSAVQVFDGIYLKDMVSWTGMVTCYAENDCFEDALELYSRMRIAGLMPNNYTFASVLKASAGLDALDAGKCIHVCALKTCYQQDSYISIALLDLYTKSGDINDAKSIFEEMPKKDVIPWSFMIARYAQSDQCEEATDWFVRMVKASIRPNQFTFSSVLQACASLENLYLAKQIHCFVRKVGLDLDVYVLNALMDVYAKCGEIEHSMQLFASSDVRNNISWNTVIVGFVHSGDLEMAFTLFSDMLRSQEKATQVTYSSLLRACACLASVKPGTQVHSLTVKTNFDKDITVSNALIDMYAKCGSIKDARLVFNKMRARDRVSWNSMISGYSMHGLGTDALKIFELMKSTEFKPDKVSFVSVLSACCNSGMLDQGKSYFESMFRDYGIEPCMEHYTCMVGLLGRSGQLDRAWKLIEGMPFEPNVLIWRTMLGACIIHNDVELGNSSAKRVLEMEPHDDATHVLLSNLYATARRWGNVASVRKRMKTEGVKKEPGLSWIEIGGVVHYFSVGDTSHPDMRIIYGMLEWLRRKVQKEGYVPNFNVVLLDVEDEEKERLLWAHSERLALAFGLVKTPSESPIRILKNLRTCKDCHDAMKFISKVVTREIVIRDMNRFHHFENGLCSCGDYW